MFYELTSLPTPCRICHFIFFVFRCAHSSKMVNISSPNKEILQSLATGMCKKAPDGNTYL